MATDFRVVTPTDMGDTIVLGAKTAGKYDVDVSKLTGLPNGVDSATLDGTTLRLVTGKGNMDVDLSPMLPAVAADVFLKAVEREGDKLKFTVGIKKDTSQDNVLEIDVADLLPVQADGVTIQGDGTAASKLSAKLSAEAGNALVQKADGLYAPTVSAQSAPARGVRLVNATGETVLGYLYDTEE